MTDEKKRYPFTVICGYRKAEEKCRNCGGLREKKIQSIGLPDLKFWVCAKCGRLCV